MSFRTVVYNKLSGGKKTVSGNFGPTVPFSEGARLTNQQRTINSQVFDSSVFIKPTATRAMFVLNHTISSNVNNFNLKNKLIDLGWNGVLPVQCSVTISPGVIVGSSSTSSPAFLIQSFPEYSEISLINNGRIQGAGGNGGSVIPPTVSSGSVGGPALSCQHVVLVNNESGQIWGGGGGGGAAAAILFAGGVGGNMGLPRYSFSASGGGGSGSVFGNNGTAAGGKDAYSADTSPYNALGSSGSSELGGAGGISAPAGVAWVTAGTGGGPGLPGLPGQYKPTASGGSGAAGGSAGHYIIGNAYVTWVSVGDCRGNVS